MGFIFSCKIIYSNFVTCEFPTQPENEHPNKINSSLILNKFWSLKANISLLLISPYSFGAKTNFTIKTLSLGLKISI